MTLFAAKHIPNYISILRMVLTLPICLTLLQRQYTVTLVLLFIAGVSDGADGFIAKHYNWQTRLGGLLDPLADKILFISVFITLAIEGLLPMWLTLIAVARDLLIINGSLMYQFIIGDVQPAPSKLSKFNTVVQILLTILLIANAGPQPINPILITGMEWLLASTLLLSGGHYTYLWGLKAVRKIF